MLTRNISGIDKACSVIGFGAWGIGGATPGATSYGDISEKAARDTIEAAYTAGMRFFDTSPAYGYGRSETRLGQVLTNKRESVIIATKGGLYRYDEAPDFSADILQKELQASLQRLQTDYVDIFQLHNPPEGLLETNSGLIKLFDHFKSSDKARAIGISVKSPAQALTLLEKYPFDTVQVNLNMMDVRALTSGLLDVCATQNISVLARTPLCFGFLSLAINENTPFQNDDHRAHWSAEQKKLWSEGAKKAQKIAENHDLEKNSSPVSKALRFCLLHPAVKTVLTGPMTVNEVRENANAGAMPMLPASLTRAILEFNSQHSFMAR